MATQAPSSPEPRTSQSTPLQQHPSLLTQQSQQHQHLQLQHQLQQQPPYSLPTSPDNLINNNPNFSNFADMPPPPSAIDVNAAAPQPMPPPPHPGSALTAPFLPFFTLIEDAGTAAHFHPTVHYIFSDDDFDPVAAHAEQLAAEETAAGAEGDSNSNSISGSNGVVEDADGEVHRRRKKQRERIVVVDVAPDGEGIVNARSLSRDWQVVGVTVTNAPTWMAEDGGGPATSAAAVVAPPERSPSAASGMSGQTAGPGASTATTATTITTATRASGEAGLMLTIEGMGQLDKVKKMESLDELAMIFNERMDSLRRVINFVEKAPPMHE